MRLGRRLSAGIAEDPPAPVPAQAETDAGGTGTPGTPEPVPVATTKVEPAAEPVRTGG